MENGKFGNFFIRKKKIVGNRVWTDGDGGEGFEIGWVGEGLNGWMGCVWRK